MEIAAEPTSTTPDSASDVYMADDIVRHYADGWASVQDFMYLCRWYQFQYRGPVTAPHFVWSPALLYGTVIEACLEELNEEKMCALLGAMVAETPQVLTLAGKPGCLLHAALARSTSRRVQLLLAVPGTTWLLNQDRKTPLHVACARPVVDPDVIHRLIDLDPHVLTLPDREGCVPPHHALWQDPSSPHVRRMIELRPETLLFRDVAGKTPLELAIGYTRDDTASLLLPFVARYPRSLAPPDANAKYGTALLSVCRSCPFIPPNMVPAVVNAYPPSLVIPSQISLDPLHKWADIVTRLPFETPAYRKLYQWNMNRSGEEEVAVYLKEETVHMALAIVEYVMGVSAFAVAEAVDADAAANVAWFQSHIKDTLQELIPHVPVMGASGLSVSQSILQVHRDSKNDENNAAMIVSDFVRALFCHERVVALLQGDARLLRKVALSEPVADLYRMNRQGRYLPSVGDEDSTSVAAALHQVDLLASISDSETVEATYLQLRGVAIRALLTDGSSRRASRP